MTEKQLHGAVVDLARMLQWKLYFTYRSKRSPAGWPDMQLVRDRLVALELKTETGRLSESQCEWIGALLDAGVATYVVRPADLDALSAILAHRGDPRLADAGSRAYEAARGLRDRTLAETRRAA